jgi:4-amino-4-deoxy-L-arabinose transferase-like glycosyltransferase
VKVKDLSTYRLPAAIGKIDWLIGGSMAGAYVVWLLESASTLGFARDEGFYFRAATDYARWFTLLFQHPAAAFERAAVDGSWSTNHEHPALMKSLFALSHMLFYEKWRLFTDASTSFRFPGMLMAGLAIFVTYLFGARAFSRRAGIMAALLFALMPRVFYHSHLDCFDIPITAMWTLSIYAYWRSVKEPGLLWAGLAAVAFGLALETKLNAWFLPAVFVPHAALVYWRTLGDGFKKGVIVLPTNLVAMGLIGPLLFYALWPWLWNDTLPRFEEYLSFHLHHEYYNMEFLGRNYFGPPSPRAYMPVMILATVPTITMVLFAYGLFDRVRNAARRVPFLRWAEKAVVDPAETDLLLALGLFAAVGPWFLEKTPIFGGTKHWMNAYPFLAIFAGRGFELVARAMETALAGVRARLALGAKVALYASVLLAPFAITVHSHPFGLSSYVPLAGGTAGAADHGLNRQFWGFTTESANAEYLQRNAPRGATVFIHDTAWDSWMRMIEEGRVRSDLRGVGTPTEAMFALVHHELHMAEIDDHIWVAFGTPSPAYVVAHDGVPIVSIYKRP